MHNHAYQHQAIVRDRRAVIAEVTGHTDICHCTVQMAQAHSLVWCRSFQLLQCSAVISPMDADT